jgi:hypothetical protein
MTVASNLTELYFFMWIFGSEYFFFDQHLTNIFLENYDIYEQFREISDKNMDILDFENIFTIYMIEAKLFLDPGAFLNGFDTFLIPLDINNLPDLLNDRPLKNHHLFDNLPNWLVPVEINDALNLNFYQHLIINGGNIIDGEKAVVSKWGLCFDLIKYFEFDWFLDRYK